MAGAFNPIGNINMKSRDLNAIAGFDREYYVSSTRQLFWVGVTLNLYKGKKRRTYISWEFTKGWE